MARVAYVSWRNLHGFVADSPMKSLKGESRIIVGVLGGARALRMQMMNFDW